MQDAHAQVLVGDADSNPVIDEDVLWSCTTCGACVNQCPVDIEHIDHIVDMRRNRVMIESDFPSELAGLFKNVENKGNPWGMNASMRNAWIEEMDFEVRVSDAPRANEIVVAVAVTGSGRPLPRIGGLQHGEIKGEDGLR